MLTMVRLQSEEQVGLMPDDLIVIDRLRASLFEAGNAAPPNYKWQPVVLMLMGYFKTITIRELVCRHLFMTHSVNLSSQS
jgi:hypothetical protein